MYEKTLTAPIQKKATLKTVSMGFVPNIATANKSFGYLCLNDLNILPTCFQKTAGSVLGCPGHFVKMVVNEPKKILIIEIQL